VYNGFRITGKVPDSVRFGHGFGIRHIPSLLMWLHKTLTHTIVRQSRTVQMVATDPIYLVHGTVTPCHVFVKECCVEIILLTYAVVTCEIKLLQPSSTSVWNYFRGLLQLMNIFQHVSCRWNNFEIISAAEIIKKNFSVLFHM